MSQSQSCTTSLSPRHKFRAPFKQSLACTSTSAVSRDILDCVVSQNNKQLIENLETHNITFTTEGSQLNNGLCVNDRCLEHVELFPTKIPKNYYKKSKSKPDNKKTMFAKSESTSKKIQSKKHKQEQATVCSKGLPTNMSTTILPQTTLINPVNDTKEINSSSVEDQCNIWEKSFSSTPASAEHHVSSAPIKQSGQRKTKRSSYKMNKPKVTPSLKSMHKNQKKIVTWSTTPKRSKRQLYNPNSGITYKGAHQTIGTSEITDHNTVKESSKVTGRFYAMADMTQVTAQAGGNKIHWPNIAHEFLGLKMAKTKGKRIAELQVLNVIEKMREEIRCLRMRQKELYQKIEQKTVLETVTCGHPQTRTPMLHVEVTSADRKGSHTLQIKQSGSRALETIGAGYGLLPSGQLLGNEF